VGSLQVSAACRHACAVLCCAPAAYAACAAVQKDRGRAGAEQKRVSEEALTLKQCAVQAPVYPPFLPPSLCFNLLQLKARALREQLDQQQGPIEEVQGRLGVLQAQMAAVKEVRVFLCVFIVACVFACAGEVGVRMCV